MYQQISISSIFLSLLIYSNYAEEVLIQIVVKKPINTVSDRYVSFSMDPAHLLDLCLTPNNREATTILVQNLGSAYFKINGGTSNRFTLDDETIPAEDNQIRILPADWQTLHQWIQTTKLKPIVSLPYSSKQWSPRNIINILGISNRLGISDCIWQLGSELNSTDTIIDYVDDLSTFKTIVDVFRKDGRNWSVKGADITTGCKPDEADLYVQLSKHISQANGWTQSVNYISPEIDETKFFQKDPSLRSLLKSQVPVWLNVPQSSQSSISERCGRECEWRGIQWANILGSSAQNGFKVVFQKIDKSEVMNPSLRYYVSVLHKQIMGEKVFDTKVLNGNNFSPKFFTHCTRNVSGSFSVMGVNFADYKTTISTKLPSKYTGSEVDKYLLNVADGHILFNGIPVNVNANLRPSVQVKKPNRLTTFTLPARSIGFWVFPFANLKQCTFTPNTESVPPVNVDNDLELSSRTASEELLHELISEILQLDSAKNELRRTRRHAVVKKDSKHMNRLKRNADPGYKTRRAVTLFKKFSDEATKNNLGALGNAGRRVTRQINNLNYNNRFGNLFKTFELPQPRKLKMGQFWNLPPQKESTLTQNRVAIPPVTSTIHDVYRVDPNEQIFKSVENSELPTGDVFFDVGEERNVDYVEFDEKHDKLGKSRKQTVNRNFGDFDVADAEDVPDHMYDFYKAKGKKQTTPEISPYSELWESDAYQKAAPPQPTDNSHFEEEKHNPEQNIDLIVKELPPTWRQDKENLMKAKSQLNTIYMTDQDMKLSTNNHQKRKFDMNDDGFFVSKRKRRSVDSNLNDEIEKKVNNLKKETTNGEEVEEEYEDFLNKNDDKINLLEKITKIIESLEKVDDIGKHKNMEKLNSEIKDLENFLLRRNARFSLLKPKTRHTQKEIRRKCKILSVNLEHQCLKENDFFPSRLINRDDNGKAKTIVALKNALPSKNSKRVRRQTTFDSSWENANRNNLIVKEMFTEREFNDFLPSISFKRSMPLDDRSNGENEEYIERIEVLQRLPDSFLSKSLMPATTERRPVPTFSLDTNLEKEIAANEFNENGDVQDYRTPRFMKKISNSVKDWMGAVEKHVSGWWHILS